MFSAFKKFGKLGAIGKAIAAAWSPLALWPDGIATPGMWISPRDLTSQWQDSTGTTPVATPGTVADSANPIGLALDIRAGAPDTLGPELVVNGDFATNVSNWNTNSCTLTWVAGDVSATSSGGGFWQEFTTVAGATYRAVALIVSGTTQLIAFQGGGLVVTLASEDGAAGARSATVTFVAATTASRIYVKCNTNAVVSSISVREIPGNHMLQSTSAARPLESARVNKFVGTELYANNAVNSNGWLGTVGAGTVTPNAMFVGSVALSQVTISASTGNKGAYNNVASPAFPFVVSGFAKADGYRYLQIYGAGTGGLGGLVFDAVAGVFSQNTNSLETSVTAEGGGAFRFSVKSPGGVDSIGFGIIPQDTVTTVYGNQSWAGDGVSGMYLGGFSLVYGDQYTPYQSVPGNGSTYDATGITPFQLYDGVDDSMATATFLAGTLINGMDCMIAVRRDSAAATYLISDTGSRGFFEWASGDTSRPDVSAGTPTYYVDGVAVTATKGALFTALTAGDWHILEARGLDLSTWTALEVSSLVSYRLNGPRGDILLYPSTASTEDKDNAREYLAEYYGVTLP